jgi:hypothetical protein
MWKLPDGKIISTPKDIVVGETQYPAQIFYRWTKEQLAELGIIPFREVHYDQKWFRSIGHVDDVVDGEIVRTHETDDRYDTDGAKEIRTEEIKSSYITSVARALGLEDFYDAVGDNVAKKEWSDYVIEMKNAAKDLKKTVDDAGSFDAVRNLKFEWPAPPDAEVPEDDEEAPVP